MASVRTADGVRLAYTVAGDEHAAPMVLLHALGERGSHWDPVAARLAGRFRLYAVDLRGHGDSDWPGAYAFDQMYADVLGLLDALGLGAVTLVGHSMGGVVAYLVAMRDQQRVHRLVVEDACPPYHREHTAAARPVGALPFDWPVVEAIAGQVSAGDPAMWAGLATITAPTLLVAGGAQSHVPQQNLVAVADRIPRCTLVTVEAGHNVHTARPEDFADAVLDWLAAG